MSMLSNTPCHHCGQPNFFHTDREECVRYLRAEVSRLNTELKALEAMVPVTVVENDETTLPPYGLLVAAYLEGASDHTGPDILWRRTGWCLMRRSKDRACTVADGWYRGDYEDALKRIDASFARVTKWTRLSLPESPAPAHEESGR